MTDEDDLLAGEYALGLLSPGEAQAVEARLRVDAPLSLRVAWWRDQFGPLADTLAVEPPPTVWQGVEARLGANDNAPVNRWRLATAGMGLIAAALLAVVVLRPGAPTGPVGAPVTAPVVAPQAQMMAAVAGDGGTVAIAYDVGRGRLTVAPTTLEVESGDAELWIIPEGDTPHSLGVVDAADARTYSVSEPLRALVRQGATFAITREAKGGSTTGSPQGPIVAQGKIFRT